jgi:2-polyprenyl-6-methoxyphenol hydroxylase-like FAD-dependent oxidoreductase
MKSADERDVVVVGARVAGAATAMLLARAGLRVSLLDRSAYGSDTVSTHGLMRAGVMQLDRWGLLPELVDAGTPPIHQTVFRYGGERAVRVSIRPGPHVPALYAPRRTLLDRVLVDAAIEAGAEVLYRHNVIDLLPDATTPGRVGGVVARGRDGRTRLRSARLTVGADGIRSVVAERAGAWVVRQATAASAVLYRYLADLDASGYEWAYGNGSATGLIPTNDGLTCVFVSTTPDRMRDLRADGGAEEAFRTLVHRSDPNLTGRVAAATAASRWHGWAGVAGFVRRSWGPGWALVGDAGYFKDPITAHGMTDGLRDAELAGRAVLAALADPRHETGALRHYQRTRDQLSHDLFDTTDAVARYDWDIPTIEGLLRKVSSAMSDEVNHLQQLPARLDVHAREALVHADSVDVAG